MQPLQDSKPPVVGFQVGSHAQTGVRRCHHWRPEEVAGVAGISKHHSLEHVNFHWKNQGAKSRVNMVNLFWQLVLASTRCLACCRFCAASWLQQHKKHTALRADVSQCQIVQGCCWTRLGSLGFQCGGGHFHPSSLMGSCQSKEEVEGRLTAAEEDIKQEFELSKQALKDWVDQAVINRWSRYIAVYIQVQVYWFHLR